MKRFVILSKSAVCLALAASLLATSGEAMETAAFLTAGVPSPSFVRLDFLRNQEKIRLETQALSLQNVASLHELLSVSPFLSRLINPSRIAPFPERGSRPAQILLRDMLAWPHRIGRYGFELIHEWSHLSVALLVVPSAWRQIFTWDSIRGNRSWADWVHALQTGRPVSGRAAKVRLGIEKPVIRQAGWLVSILPIVALVYELFLYSPWSVAFGTLFFSGILKSIGRSFYSDFLAPIVPGEYACGVDGVDKTLSPAEQGIPYSLTPISEAVSELSMAQGEVTVMRGMHEAGASIRVGYKKDGRLHYKILTAKVVAAKRDYLPELLEQEIQRKVAWEHVKHPDLEFTGRLIVLKHFRYSTSSDPTIEAEAHPLAGEATRRAVMYRQENGRRVKVNEDVHIVITHNGDLNNVVWFDGQVLTEKEFKERTRRILRNPDHPDEPNPNEELMGDSPTAAMAVSLFRTQFDAYASLRLGMLQALGKTPGLHVDLTPARLDRLKDVFEQAIDQEDPALDLTTLSPAQAADLEKRLVQAFENETRNNPAFWQELPASMMQPVVHASLTAFLENDLFRAMQIFSERASPSFGMGVLSSVDEDMVFFAKQQPFSLARNLTTNSRGWNSEQRSLTIETAEKGEWAYEDRFDLRPYNGGEVVRFHEEGTVDVYEVASKRRVPEKEAEARWFNMSESPFTALTRRHAKDKPKSLVDLDDAAHFQREADRIWSNPRSYNRTVAGNISKQLQRLATLQKEGRLPPGSHVAVVGFWTDLAQAHNLVDLWKEYYPALKGFHIELVPANQVLLNPEVARQKYGLGPETVVLVLDYFGQQFPTINAATYLIRRCPYVFGITGGVEGDLDNPLAVAMGQNLKAGSPLAGNIITTGSPWPSTQAMPYCHTNMMATLNYLFLQVTEDLIDAAPNPRDRPFGIQLEKDEIEELRAMQRQEADELAMLTGTGRDLATRTGSSFDVMPSTRLHLQKLGARLHYDFTEARAVRYAFRVIPLIGVIWLMNYLGWAPHVWAEYIVHPLQDLAILSISGMLHFFGRATPTWIATAIRLPYVCGPLALSVLRTTVDAAFFITAALPILGILRFLQGRQLFSRQGLRVVGIAHPEDFLFAEHDWNMYFGLSYPDATALVVGGDSVSSLNNEFVKRVKPKMSRSSWMINVQTDADLPSLDMRSDASKRTATAIKVERSIPMERFFRKLNKILQYFKLRIPYASTQVITIGRSWPANPNAEDVRIQMPTVFFPLPPTWNRFLLDVESAIGAQEGHPDFHFSPPQRRLFARVMQDPATDPQGGLQAALKIAAQMDIPSSKTALVFAKAFVGAQDTLFNLSPAEQARRMRIEQFVGRRIYPIGDLIALDVLGEDAARRTNSSRFFYHRRAPTGFTQSAAVIDTTATPVSGAEVAKYTHEPILLKDFSVPLIQETQARVEARTVGEGQDVYELNVTQPHPRRTGSVLPAGLNLIRPHLDLSNGRATLKVWHDLADVTATGTLRITLFTLRGKTKLTVPLADLPSAKWNTLVINTKNMSQHLKSGPLIGCNLAVVDGEGLLRVERSLADAAEPWIGSLSAGQISIETEPTAPAPPTAVSQEKLDVPGPAVVAEILKPTKRSKPRKRASKGIVSILLLMLGGGLSRLSGHHRTATYSDAHVMTAA